MPGPEDDPVDDLDIARKLPWEVRTVDGCMARFMWGIDATAFQQLQYPTRGRVVRNPRVPQEAKP
jgi:hypothetical protein